MSRKAKTTEQYIEQVKSVHGDYYDYSQVKYIDSFTNINIVCPIHGNFEQRPDSHLQGKGCSACRYIKLSEDFSDDKQSFIKKAQIIHNDLYDYDNVIYKNAYQKVEIVCSIHGSFYQMPRNHIFAKAGCPKCNSSKGEQVIRNILLKYNVIFSEQYRNPDCRDKYTLPFDFYLPDYDLLIEFHGKQHYEFTPYLHKTIDRFESSCKRDSIKKEWATQNMNYLEISYKDIYNIETILTTYLKL